MITYYNKKTITNKPMEEYKEIHGLVRVRMGWRVGFANLNTPTEMEAIETC